MSIKGAFTIIIGITASILLLGCGKDSNSENVVDKLTVQNAAFTEGNSNQLVEIMVSLEGSLVSELSVPFEIIEESAMFGVDFLAEDGEVVFAPDKMEAVIPIEIAGDEHFELSETFSIRLNVEGRPVNFGITIKDDDEIGEVLLDEEGFYTPSEYPSMTLKWSDEFNADQLNSADWTYEIGNGCNEGICGWGNEELEEYTDAESNSRLEEGKLIITARKEEGDYTSARIKTEDKVEVQFGRIDIRAKLPKGQGIWPAIWMLGANIDQVDWPAAGEIDIMELVGHQPDVVHGTVHYDDGGYKTSSSSRALPNGNYSEQFHVFTLIWERDQMSWYVDNQKFKTFTSSGVGFYPFNAPFYFIMNVAVGGRWPGNPDQTTSFPQEMVVDYIRVFQ